MESRPLERKDSKTRTAPVSATVPGVLKDGWLYWGQKVGDIIMWKKRWTILTLHKLLSFKSHMSLDAPVDTVLVASIEEMAFGKFMEQKYAFTVQVPADATNEGKISLASVTEDEREEWVQELRKQVPKAKVELAKEILLRKTEKEASAKHAQQQIKAAIESIDRDSERVAVFKGFKTYADDLAKHFQGLLVLVDKIPSIGQGVAKKDAFQECAYHISILVDAANSTTAMCTNKGLIDEIVVRTGDIAVEMANILGYAIRPVHHENLPNAIFSIRDQTQQVLELLSNAAALQQELDDAKALFGGSQKKDRERIDDFDIEGAVAGLTDKAKEAQDTLKKMQDSKDPKLVGEYSRQAATLMCELMEATSFVAFQAGLDEDGEFLEASIAGGINEHTRQQLLSMMGAAKGFAAATTNMIDLLKQVPEGDVDELLEVKLNASERSADNALAAFMAVTGSFDMDPLPVWEPLNFDDPAFESSADVAETDAESELLDALRAIEESIAKLSAEVSEKQSEVTKANEKAQMGGIEVPDDGSISPQVMSAAKDMGQATAKLVSAAAEAQKKLKQEEPATSGYRKEDASYQRGIVASAQAVSEATNFLMEVSMRPDSTPEDVIAAARCANAANARLVAYARVKADLESAAQIDQAAKEISRTTKRLVAAAKKQKGVSQEKAVEERIEAMKKLPVTRQMKHKIEAQTNISKLEVALDNARKELFAMRRKVYARDKAVLKGDMAL